MFATPYSTLRDSLAEIQLAIAKREADAPLDLYVKSPTDVVYYGCKMGRLRTLPHRMWRCLRNDVCRNGVCSTILFIIRKIFNEFVLLKDHICRAPLRGVCNYVRQRYSDWKNFKPEMGNLEPVIEEVVHKLFDDFVSKAYNARQRRIVHQVKLIGETFNQPVHEGQRERYVRYLQEDLKESKVGLAKWEENLDSIIQKEMLQPHDLVLLKRLVTRVSEAVRECWDHNVEVQKNLGEYINDPEGIWAINDKGLSDAIRKEQALINLEGLLFQQIPMIELIRLCQFESDLTETDNQTINQWIEGLNTYAVLFETPNSQEVIDAFEVALREVIKLVDIEGSFNISLVDLMFKLDTRGCKLIPKSNPTHEEWRESLKEGSEITCNGVPLVLGKRLSPDDNFDDRYVVYEVKDHDWVIQIASNRFMLQIDQLKIVNQHTLIPHVRMVQDISSGDGKPVSGLDEHGRCVILEKLDQPVIDTLDWKSTSPILAEEDYHKAEVFASILYSLYEARAWPVKSDDNRVLVTKPLSLKELMWKDDVLWTTRLIQMERQPPLGATDNYLAAEKCCIDIAHGNPYLLQFLMRVSQYAEHPMAQFYREQIKEKVETGNFSTILDASLPWGHNKKFYIDRLNKLCEKTEKYLSRSLKQLKVLNGRGELGTKWEKEKLKTAVFDRFLEIYMASSTPGTIPKTMVDEVVNSFKEGYRPIGQGNDRYYDQVRAEVLRKNQLAQGVTT